MVSYKGIWAASLASLALACGAEKPVELPPGVRPLEQGLSQHHMEVTANPLAQKYFDQGMRLVYAFNHAEAIRAFKAAQILDPACAMCFWGESLALGPNINAPMEATAVKPAVEALAKATERAPKVSVREQAYVKALAARYSDAPDADRAALDQAYAGAMRELVKQYPDDLDAATLFAESLMDLTPWAYWTKRGEATEYTAEILAQIERVLAANPSHLGANHYYIHAVEASGEPGKALASAKLLESIAPTAGHLVHMPAHTYMRIGRYREASVANEKGAAADEAYMAWCKSGGFYTQAYYPHNLHFLWASETFEGKSEASLATARKLSETITADAARAVPPAHELYAVRYFAPVRFGKWDQILAEPAPPEDLRYATGMYHWARGMALAGGGKLAEAASERETLVAISQEDAVKSLAFLEGPASQLLEVASHLLAADIAAKQGKTDDALAELEQAQGKESSLGYTEPPGWPLPVRQYQGAALLEAGRAAEAETVFREDLKDYPENGWALYGLAASLRAQNKPADEVDARFASAWSGADVKLTHSRF